MFIEILWHLIPYHDSTSFVTSFRGMNFLKRMQQRKTTSNHSFMFHYFVPKTNNMQVVTDAIFILTCFNAAVNGKLELTLLKGRQRFDTVSTSNLKV